MGATKIYQEKVSGVRADRPQFDKMMSALQAGDVVTVTKLDRLAAQPGNARPDRPYRQGGGVIPVLLWDTGSAQDRLLSTLLAAIAEFEPLTSIAKSYAVNVNMISRLA